MSKGLLGMVSHQVALPVLHVAFKRLSKRRDAGVTVPPFARERAGADLLKLRGHLVCEHGR